MLIIVHHVSRIKITMEIKQIADYSNIQNVSTNYNYLIK